MTEKLYTTTSNIHRDLLKTSKLNNISNIVDNKINNYRTNILLKSVDNNKINNNIYNYIDSINKYNFSKSLDKKLIYQDIHYQYNIDIIVFYNNKMYEFTKKRSDITFSYLKIEFTRHILKDTNSNKDIELIYYLNHKDITNNNMPIGAIFKNNRQPVLLAKDKKDVLELQSKINNKNIYKNNSNNYSDNLNNSLSEQNSNWPRVEIVNYPTREEISFLNKIFFNKINYPYNIHREIYENNKIIIDFKDNDIANKYINKLSNIKEKNTLFSKMIISLTLGTTNVKKNLNYTYIKSGKIEDPKEYLIQKQKFLMHVSSYIVNIHKIIYLYTILL